MARDIFCTLNLYDIFKNCNLYSEKPNRQIKFKTTILLLSLKEREGEGEGEVKKQREREREKRGQTSVRSSFPLHRYAIIPSPVGSRDVIELNIFYILFDPLQLHIIVFVRLKIITKK